MPILRLNAGPDGLALHGSPASAWRAVSSAAFGSGPVIVMVHGFKYDPFCAEHSPHTSLFTSPSQTARRHNVHFLHHLGFGAGDPNEGLAIVFAWRARGSLWKAHRAAAEAGQYLASIIETIHVHAPDRPVHVITHSMGSEVVFAAMHALPAHSVHRIVTLTGASYASRVTEAMQHTQAGRSAALINVTSGENDPFDFIFERIIQPPEHGDFAMGRGIALRNAITLRLDCTLSLTQLRRFGGHISPPCRRVSHWSGYTRSGALKFYAHALRNPDAVPLDILRQSLPVSAPPRWSHMFSLPQIRNHLLTAQKSP